MRKVTLLYWIVVGAFLAFALEVFSGFVLWLAFETGPGFGGRRGLAGVEPPGRQEFMLISRQNWLNIHDWTAVALMVIVLFHLILHWRWIVNTSRRLLAG